eukprot:2547683-Pyramimonas_sp.AAC.1
MERGSEDDDTYPRDRRHIGLRAVRFKPAEHQKGRRMGLQSLAGSAGRLGAAPPADADAAALELAAAVSIFVFVSMA